VFRSRAHHTHTITMMNFFILSTSILLVLTPYALSQCADSTSFRLIRLNNIVEEDGCRWIRKQPARITRYCSEGHVIGACPNTCNRCGTPCIDTPGYNYSNPTNPDVTRFCPFIAARLNQRVAWCFEDIVNENNRTTTSVIGDNCLES
jgi:hypothetical protein